MTPKPPSRKQLACLRQLANRTGQTFTYPATSGQASAQIRRLKAAHVTGFTFAELQAEEAARETHGEPLCRVRAFEVNGYNSTAAWSQRS